MKNLIINEELKTLLPPLSAEEFAGLEESILKDGCLSPLIEWDGILVDGHHRYEICTKHQIPYAIKSIVLENLDDAKLWAGRHQESRRNLSDFHKAELALKLKDVVAARARERQRAAGGDKTRGALPPTLAEAPTPRETRQELAQIAGISHGNRIPSTGTLLPKGLPSPRSATLPANSVSEKSRRFFPSDGYGRCRAKFSMSFLRFPGSWGQHFPRWSAWSKRSYRESEMFFPALRLLRRIFSAVRVLSNGEQFRAGLARLICEKPERVVIDEFTSVIDRRIALIGSQAFQKAWRRSNPKGKAVLLTPHYDILDWVNPDWVLDLRTGRFVRGCLRRRPGINVDIFKVNQSYWKFFKQHYYLDLPFPPAAECFVGLADGNLQPLYSCD